MREHPDHHDAELLLRLYDLRREEKLHQARDWFLQEFQAESLQDLHARFPLGSRENTFFRMVTGYWEMAASIVNHGLIKEEFFFENTDELWVVWQKVKHLAPAARKMYHNPFIWKNLEAAAEKFEKWMTQRAPEAIDALRKIVLEASQKKG
jgi:hypothetical protein